MGNITDLYEKQNHDKMIESYMFYYCQKNYDKKIGELYDGVARLTEQSNKKNRVYMQKQILLLIENAKNHDIEKDLTGRSESR